jgi:hypothetical protein
MVEENYTGPDLTVNEKEENGIPFDDLNRVISFAPY